jgi:histone-lysine N-methyltransferase SETMAR
VLNWDCRADKGEHISTGKVLAIVLWDCEGIFLVKFVKRGATINQERYVQTFKKLKQQIPRVERNRGMNHVLCWHDARPHTIIATVRWTAIPHTPYSPDLAPSDLLLSGFLKMHSSDVILWMSAS